jgi:hypothetical protein
MEKLKEQLPPDIRARVEEIETLRNIQRDASNDALQGGNTSDQGHIGREAINKQAELERLLREREAASGTSNQ